MPDERIFVNHRSYKTSSRLKERHSLLYSLFGKGKLLRRKQRWLSLNSGLFSLQHMREKLFNLDTDSTKVWLFCERAQSETRASADTVPLTDLLQTGAQVAAEDEADPVYFHAMDASLGVAFLHSLQVGFLVVERLQLVKQILFMIMFLHDWVTRIHLLSHVHPRYDFII